jgi:putative DNA primase/helicase
MLSDVSPVKLNAEISCLQTQGAVDRVVLQLAKLSPLEYDQQRNAIAKKFNLRLETLDREVEKARRSAAQTSGKDIIFEELDPWPEPVDGAKILNEIVAALNRYVVLPDGASEAIALWIMHTYTFDVVRISPILALTSPEKRCGKTTVMSLLLKLAHRPIPASNISPAALFRSTERWRPTLLCDEADSFLKSNDELRGILNSGHTVDMAYVLRTVGDEHEPRRFSTWAPKALACIGRLSETLADRAITIPMRRKKAGEAVERLKVFDGRTIRQQCLRWAKDIEGALKSSDPDVPASLHDRAADNWTPLLAISDVAGGDWPSMARKAAQRLTETDMEEEGIGVLLLGDIQTLFRKENTDRLSSQEIADKLSNLEERPWADWKKGKPISTNQIARILKNYKVRPDEIKINGRNLRGYKAEDLQDTFERYLVTPSQTATPLPCSNDAAFREIQSATQQNEVAGETGLEPAPNKESSRVADQNAEEWNQFL